MNILAKQLRVFSLIGLALFSSACASKNPMPEQAQTSDFVLQELGQAIENAHSELSTLSELRGKGVEVLLPPPDSKLAIKMTTNWTTTANEALKDICLAVGYSYKEIGYTAHELPVVVYAKDTSAYELLEDISLQVQAKAMVKIDTISQTISLVYPSKN